MAQNRDQFAVVVARLRERLRDGLYVNGEPLTVNDLARDFGVSATPVREALAWLAGEGLVEDRRGRGYFGWRMDVADLTDLYRAQEILTLTALAGLNRCPARRQSGEGAGPLQPVTGGGQTEFQDDRFDGVLFWEALTWRVAREAGYRFLLGEQKRLADRLAPARRAEPKVLFEGVGSLNALADQVNRKQWVTLNATLAPFFSRRRAAANAIVDELRSDPQFRNK